MKNISYTFSRYLESWNVELNIIFTEPQLTLRAPNIITITTDKPLISVLFVRYDNIILYWYRLKCSSVLLSLSLSACVSRLIKTHFITSRFSIKGRVGAAVSCVLKTFRIIFYASPLNFKVLISAYSNSAADRPGRGTSEKRTSNNVFSRKDCVVPTAGHCNRWCTMLLNRIVETRSLAADKSRKKPMPIFPHRII